MSLIGSALSCPVVFAIWTWLINCSQCISHLLEVTTNPSLIRCGLPNLHRNISLYPYMWCNWTDWKHRVRAEIAPMNSCKPKKKESPVIYPCDAVPANHRWVRLEAPTHIIGIVQTKGPTSAHLAVDRYCQKSGYRNCGIACEFNYWPCRDRCGFGQPNTEGVPNCDQGLLTHELTKAVNHIEDPSRNWTLARPMLSWKVVCQVYHAAHIFKDTRRNI